MEKTNEKLLSLVYDVGRLIREKIHSGECLGKFANSEFEVLKFVQKRKGVTMKDIADHLHIKPSSVTPVVDKLEKTGNLKRFQCKNDRRVVYIILSKRGLGSLEKIYKNIRKIIEKVFGKLNKADKKNLINILEKIHAENIK